MKPNRVLIDALRRAADRIENRPDEYCWHALSTCNCGILAQEILDLSRSDLQELMDDSPYTTCAINWTEIAQELRQCPVTGIGVVEMYKSLLQAGLDPEDFEYIEFLGQTTEMDYQANPEPADNSWTFHTKEAVVPFFRELASQLETRIISSKSKSAQTQTVTVGL